MMMMIIIATSTRPKSMPESFAIHRLSSLDVQHWLPAVAHEPPMRARLSASG
jgi:hypothetical protein